MLLLSFNWERTVSPGLGRENRGRCSRTPEMPRSLFLLRRELGCESLQTILKDALEQSRGLRGGHAIGRKPARPLHACTKVGRLILDEIETKPRNFGEKGAIFRVRSS